MTRHTTNRREFLAHAAGLAVAPSIRWGGRPDCPTDRRDAGPTDAAEPTDGADLIIRQADPPNLEFPFSSLNSFITPNDRFFVRNHFPVPKIDAKSWRLKIDGAVENPLELTYEDQLRMPVQTRTVTLECAGNGRSFLNPKVKGVQWALGAVSNAEWHGVPLAAILQKAGIRDTAVDVILEGTDEGELKDEPKPPGKVRFARSVPLEKAKKDVLLAHRMNGQPLTAAHGFPLRAIVPGWYGMASIKWLSRIIVSMKPFAGYYQTLDYSVFSRRDGHPVQEPITEMQVKAQIASPQAGTEIALNKDCVIRGAAWAGEPEVTKVEVSTDGGKSWSPAQLLGMPAPFAWRLWEYQWRPRTAGKHILMARATDARGRSQPVQRDPDRRTYVINHVLPVEVEVRS